MDTIPCIVRDLDVTQQMEIALIENLQREDLNPMEAARGIDALKTQCGYTQEKIAARLGMSRPAVANMLRLLTLPDEVTEMVRDGLLTAGHARVLAGLNSREDQIRLAHRAADEGMNVRQLEQLAASLKPDRPARKRKAPEEQILHLILHVPHFRGCDNIYLMPFIHKVFQGLRRAGNWFDAPPEIRLVRRIQNLLLCEAVKSRRDRPVFHVLHSYILMIFPVCPFHQFFYEHFDGIVHIHKNPHCLFSQSCFLFPAKIRAWTVPAAVFMQKNKFRS